MSFMDIPFLPLTPGSPARFMLSRTTIDPERARALTTALLIPFLAGTDLTTVIASDTIRTSTTPLSPVSIAL